MKAYLFKTITPKTYHYWLIETIQEEYAVNCRVYECTELEWADAQPLGSVHVIDEWDFEDPHRLEHTMMPDLYVEVSVAEKYYFPKFSRDFDSYSY